MDDVKTQESRKQLVIASELLGALKTWKQASEFSEPRNWIFASPIHNGKMPWSDDQVWRLYQKAPKQRVSAVLVLTAFVTHTTDCWIVGTTVGVMQRLMRHADPRTTMQYGDAYLDDMAEAHSKVVDLALNGAQTERRPS